MRHILILSACWAIAVPANAAGGAAHDWAIYANAKYQFQTCYPADLLHPQGESPASDGQVFANSDGGKLTASAIYNVDNQTVAQIADETGQRLAGEHGQVTYRHVTRNGFTLSGTSSNMIFYTKTILSHDAQKHFEIIYPATLATTYNPIAARLQACFNDLQK